MNTNTYLSKHLPTKPCFLLLVLFSLLLASVQLIAPTGQLQKHKHQFYQKLYHVGSILELSTCKFSLKPGKCRRNLVVKLHQDLSHYYAKEFTIKKSYPNVPLTVLQRKGTEGAGVHVAKPKSHNCIGQVTISQNMIELHCTYEIVEVLTSWAGHQCLLKENNCWLVDPPKIDNYLIVVFK